ncbi:hypothetical protein N798_13095 [Knoellia flava TL1]|uniref:Uncharacterized protein n=2 Tax=Knoellia flava TaxID=913969 RepID=A0A8H9FS15_9MICO|nr:hypothetical protein [Knoellia flava]KGN29610.1 hypothetical protein N798_13095 [Knoellia flava TL1]GGB76197.1 hypothetical protein GCM10011314_14700 [Knoellia flava]
MNGWAGVAVVGLSLLAWSIVIDVRYDMDDRLARWLVPAVRRWGRWYALGAFVLSLSGLAVFAALACIGYALAGPLGDPRWALLVLYPAQLLYAPSVLAMAPSDPHMYRFWRESLRRSGARAAEERWIAWSGGVPAFMGMVALMVSLFPVFLG